MADLENKKIFLVASGHTEDAQSVEEIIKNHVQNPTVFLAADGTEALFKSENVTPHVVIVDANIQKMNCLDLIDKLLYRKDKIAVIVITDQLDKEHFVNEVVTGQLQFLVRPVNEKQLAKAITRSLNWISFGENSNYHLRFFDENEVVINFGETGDFVYLVKSGKLKAYRDENGQEVILGYIQTGEFVGEMSYINGEPRSASVVCMEPCELIEIPNNYFDVVLFSKPSWSKALVKTLSQRLKTSNEEKAVKTT
ncbi:MAG: cyclic nucleotide-binding domain-containing protein [Pseudobdellovibrionaceae bacterium]